MASNFVLNRKQIYCVCSFFILTINTTFGQTPLFIPPVMSGTSFDLNIQSGTHLFYTNPTPTYGINGGFLSPTLVVNKGDVVTMNVNNGLNVATTMHWHGLHVAPENDGGPHQSIAPGTSWNPTFEILNDAATYWYHPHGEGKTELHVGKGLSGLIIVHDPAEQALNLPETYGVDDIPLILQTKAFDVLQQIAIADHMDTGVFVNGTWNASFAAPAQVIRLRLVNGNSMRSFYVGFSNDMTFYQIATDGGLIENPLALTRFLLAPGERTELLVDLTGMNGQTLQLLSYGSEMPNGIFGSPSLGMGPDTLEGYTDNFLNGTDFQLLDVQVGPQTANPITTIPNTLIPYIPYLLTDAEINRTLVFDTIRLLPSDVPNLAAGPFGINERTFNMDSINIRIPLNSTEIWTLKNNTHIAHPFHIHDIQFNVIEKNGIIPPLSEQGWKDVVLVMPHDSVKFITKFKTFSDTMVPYMYHCHLLHHEDDGMMGSFIVYDPNAGLEDLGQTFLKVYPNPASQSWIIEGLGTATYTWKLQDALGRIRFSGNSQGENTTLNTELLEDGVYFLQIFQEGVEQTIQLIKN